MIGFPRNCKEDARSVGHGEIVRWRSAVAFRWCVSLEKEGGREVLLVGKNRDLGRWSWSLVVHHETVDDVGRSTGAFIGGSFGEGREVAGALSASEKFRSLSGGFGSL